MQPLNFSPAASSGDLGLYFPLCKDQLAAMSVELWQCTEQTPVSLTGSVFTFVMPDEYRGTTEDKVMARYHANARSFPGVVPTEVDINYLNPNKSEEVLQRETIQEAYYISYDENTRIKQMLDGTRVKVVAKLKKKYAEGRAGVLKHRSILNELGFLIEEKEGKPHLSLPDIPCLEARWDKLRERFPKLSPLPLEVIAGVASNSAFRRAFLEGKTLVSTNEHFIHDMIYHVLPKICILLEEGIGDDRQECSRQMIGQALSIINREKQLRGRSLEVSALKVSATIYMDGISSVSNIAMLSDADPKMEGFSSVLDSFKKSDGENWKKYLVKEMKSKALAWRPELRDEAVENDAKMVVRDIASTWSRFLRSALI